MLRIRLSRTGKKKQPSYRVVVADVDAKRDGRIVERIGHYNPLTQPSQVNIKEARALYWLSVGAQPSDTVRHLLEKQGTIARLQRLHAGEPLEALVAEYEGQPAPVEAAAEPEPEAAAEPEPEAAAEPEPEAAAEAEPEAVAEPEPEAAAEPEPEAAAEAETEEEESPIARAVDTVTETVSSAVETVTDVVADAVEAVTGDDEEEEA